MMRRDGSRQGQELQSNLSTALKSTDKAHRLHDQMLLLIAQVCRGKGADVYEDPKSVDLLVIFRNTDFIIEVKTVTPENFVARVRYAMGTGVALRLSPFPSVAGNRVGRSLHWRPSSRKTLGPFPFSIRTWTQIYCLCSRGYFGQTRLQRFPQKLFT